MILLKIKKKSHLTKCDTIAPNLEINEICFRHNDPDVHAAQKLYLSIEKFISYERLKMNIDTYTQPNQAYVTLNAKYVQKINNNHILHILHIVYLLK